MIISEQWLRDWVQLDLSAQEIADCLTSAGLEVESVEPVAEPIDNLLVGKVTTVEKHPDADRLNITKVDIGDEQLDIVCGARNVRQGLMVAVATVGAKLPNGLKIKRAKVRGIESNGMLCSASELGLDEESAGILELDVDAQIGQRVDEYLQLDDTLIDIDLTPNRGDCLSVQGIARELKVLANGNYHPLDIDTVPATIEQSIVIDIADSVACPRYLGRVIKNVDQSATTPLWMQERLRRSGLRPISPIVDITNYVMMELGQPMHAFDLAKLNDKIVVRQSQKGEKISLLDGSTATLDGDTLVIADAKGALAIAGVMGGSDSAIDDSSTNIVLEAAHFTRKSAAGKARRYGLHTESSYRFERGVDPQLPPQAMERATELVLEICGGEAGPVVEEKQDKSLQGKPAVSIRLERLKSLLGMELGANEVSAILNRIADSVVGEDDQWSVKPPSYRFDIEREADLVEEVARVKGYDNIPTAMPRIAPRSVTASESSVGIRQVRQSFIARDYREAITYSFIDPAAQKMFSDEQPVKLSNPLADNMAVMRTSIIPGLMTALQFNANRQHDRIRLFEIGATYHKTSQGFVERQKLSGVACGSLTPVQWGLNKEQKVDFYDIKADLEAVLSLTGHKNPIIFNGFKHIALHPGQLASLVRDNSNAEQTNIGWLGRLHPSIEKHFGVSNVFAFELELDNALAAELPVFSSVSPYPSIKRDLSVVISENLPIGDVISSVRTALGDALIKVELFDVYRGQGVAENAKSVSLSLILQHADKTMTDEYAEQMVGAALSVLESDCGAQLRS
ncbi:MAG: phenylalanyl-tRNA synthetase beta chain [Cryomorphaceae bacterium]|jgi:phenylalanyl-tRNA synthetase beta chain